MKNLGKLFEKMLGLVFASAILFIGVACENDSSSNSSGGPTNPPTVTVTGIEVTGGTREFGAGDTLAIGTLTVKKVMSDGTKPDLSNTEYTVVVTNASGTEVAEGAMLYEGTYTVTVTYSGKSDTYTITVGPAVLSEITIKNEPNNAGKFVGDALNKVGLEITAIYSDNRTKELDAESEGVTVSPETLTSTSNTITVTYNDGTTTQTATFTVDATAVEIESIEVTTNPKTSYMGSNKTIDLTGMEVTATYNNGKTEKLTADEYTTNVAELSFGDTDEEKTLTVTLKSDTTKTDSVTLYYSVDTLTLDSIAIKSNPTKMTYFVGDAFEVDGLVIAATYNKSSSGTTTRDVTPTLSDVNVNMNTAGTNEATVSYTDGETKTATFNVTVNAITLSSISITTEPAKKDYIVGEAVDLTGIVVNAVYNDTRKNKTLGKNEVTATLATFATAGENVDVTVSYTDGGVAKTATYKVNVAAKPTFTVTVAGDKDISIEKSGNTLTANLNGITGTPTYQWSVDGTNVSTTNTYTASALASGEVRIVTLIVTVDGTKYSANITVKN